MNNSRFIRAGGGVLLAVLLAVSIASGEGFRYKDVDIRWDNTIKYSTAFRVAGPDPNMLVDANFDDAANNFPKRSFFSNRVDLLSEFDIKTRNFGIRASGAGWYDSIYATDNNNTSLTSNNFSVAPSHFTKATREYAARRFELLDGFVFIRKPLGGDKQISLRVGRQTLLWGTALYFGSNSIAFSQAPLDGNKGAISPDSQAKELFMPTGQVFLSIKPGSSYSFEGFWQFEQRKNVMPAAGTYFSPFDAPDIGGERLLVGGGAAFFRGQDLNAANSGNFGVAFMKKFRKPKWETGFYFYQANSRNPMMVLKPGAAPCPFPPTDPLFAIVCPTGMLIFNPSVVNLAIGQIGEFIYAYPEHIKVAGMSFSANLPGATGGSYAGEVSYRWNMPLNSMALIDPSPVPTWDQAHHPLWAVGNTFHANFNIMQSLGRRRYWHSALVIAEVGYNHLMKITRNPALFNRADRQTDAISFAVNFIPSWYQVLPGLDIDLPFTMFYSPKARSAAADTTFGADRGGNFSQGVALTYNKVWKASIKYNHYWGKDKLLNTGPNTGASSGLQFFRGKDFVSISMQRTF